MYRGGLCKPYRKTDMLVALSSSLLCSCYPPPPVFSVPPPTPTLSSWHCLLESSSRLLLGTLGLEGKLRAVSSVCLRRTFVSWPRSALHCLYNQTCPLGFVPPALSRVGIPNKSCSVLCNREYLHCDSSSLPSGSGCGES